MDGPRKDLSPLFDMVMSHVPATVLDKDAPFAMVASILDYDNFLGRVLTGRVEQGRARINMPVKVLRSDGSVVETGRLTKLMGYRGLDRVQVDEVEAGDIVLVRSDPRDVARIVGLSRATYRKMVQNLWWAAGYNIVAIPAAAGVFAGLGFVLSPALGAVLMSASTVIVALNAQLLRRAEL